VRRGSTGWKSGGWGHEGVRQILRPDLFRRNEGRIKQALEFNEQVRLGQTIAEDFAADFA
jgi:hypothetical protein